MLILRCYPRITDWLYVVSNQTIDLRIIPIYSYGFFVAVAFLVAAAIAVYLLKKRENAGILGYEEVRYLKKYGFDWIDSLSYIILGAYAGLKIVGYSAYRSLLEYDPQGYLLSLKGSFLGLILGAVAGFGVYFVMKRKEEKQEPEEVVEKIYPHQRIGDLLIIAAVLGVLGANLFNLLENPEEYAQFWEDPVGSLFSGLSVFGGLICAAAGFWVYAKWKKIPVSHLFDAVAPGFIMANGIGRLGCQVSGDGDWGIINNLPTPAWLPEFLWKDSYAHNITGAGLPIPGCIGRYCSYLDPPVYPTPIWEFVLLGLCCAVLVWSSIRFMRLPYVTFGLFLVLAGTERLFIEQFRDWSDRHPVSVLGYSLSFLGRGMKQAEFISLLMIACGISLCFYIFYKQVKSREP